jgi:hypothetical protein
MRSRLAAALLAIGVVVGLSTAAHAAQSGSGGASLFDGGRDVTVAACGHDADVTALAVLTSSPFDAGADVTFSVQAPAGLTVTGDTVGTATQWPVAIHVPAGTAAGVYTVHALAAGFRHGLPSDVTDYVRVHISC